MAEKYTVEVSGVGGGAGAASPSKKRPSVSRSKSRPPGEDSDEEDREGIIELMAEEQEIGEQETAACCESCVDERLPISRLEQRELRHNVAEVPRKCTDCLCVVFYSVFCFVWLGVAAAAIYFGNSWALTHGSDYQGRLCGYSPGVEDKPLVAYPRLNKDLIEFGLGLGMELTDIGNLDLSTFSFEQIFEMNITGICVEGCPTVGTVICSVEYLNSTNNVYPDVNDVAACNNGDPFSEEYLLGLFNLYSVENPFLCSHCWVAPLNSTEIFNRCLDIITTTIMEEEVCVFPVNTSISASDPNCQTKVVTKTEISTQPAYDNPIAELFGSIVQTVNGWVQSVAVTWYVIVILGILGALVLGFAYVLFMRWCAGFVVWISIVGIILVALVFGAWCYIKSGWVPAAWVDFVAQTLGEMGILDAYVVDVSVVEAANSTVGQAVFGTLDIDISEYSIKLEDAWKVFAVLMTVVVVVLIIVVIAIAKKINIAIALIEASSKVLMRLPGLISLPFVTAIVVIAFTGWMVFLLLMITSLEDFNVDTVLSTFQFEQYFDDCPAANASYSASNGNSSSPSSFDFSNSSDWQEYINEAACASIGFVKQYGETPLEVCMIVYHLFMYLWTVQFIHAVMICMVAGAICDWYWTRPSGKNEVKGGDGQWGDPICKSCVRTFRFHLGSMLFGALIVAIVQIIRWIMAYIDKKTRAWQNKNKCLKCMFKVIHCCLCCFEKCIKFISKNAYIMVAMEGHPFCDSCCHSMKLMLRNIVQFAVLNVFSQVVVMLGKIFIIAVVTGSTYAWITAYDFGEEVSTVVFPTILAAVV
eukprot:INCI9733.1.p1 GENE.INCI9733.1~~INCI9733.1.p1  ORF type:complete len:813 (+),score=137.87 INCI9733.1:160-2598(+)